MKPETWEWIDKAEGDRKVARREIQTADPVWNVVCFLAQQRAEKYLKGFLEEHNIAFGIGLTETGIGTPQYFRHCNPLSRNTGR